MLYICVYLPRWALTDQARLFDLKKCLLKFWISKSRLSSLIMSKSSFISLLNVEGVQKLQNQQMWRLE